MDYKKNRTEELQKAKATLEAEKAKIKAEQAAEQAASQSAPVEEQTPAESKETENAEEKPKEASPKEGKVDYKAELERVRAERDQFKVGLYAAKNKIKRIEKEEKEPVKEEVEEDKQSLDDIVEDKISSFKSDIVKDTIGEELESLSSDPDEQELMMEIYENNLTKSGYSRKAIRQDLLNSKLLANRSKIIQENMELKEALKTKKSITNLSSGTHVRPEVETGPTLNAAERAILERVGLKSSDVGKDMRSKFSAKKR